MSLFEDPINVTDPASAVEHANTITNGAIGIGIPVSVFFIILIVGIARKSPKDVTFTTASFIFTILSAILVWGNYLNGIFVIAGIIMTALGAMWMRVSSSSPY